MVVRSAALLAVGGGSKIDMAKSIHTLLGEESRCLDIVLGKSEPKTRSPITMVAIPTTSGTGSEATSFSVVYIAEEKYSLSTCKLDYAILDYRFVIKAPAILAACTGFDALTANTTGSDNVAIGYDALSSNTTADYGVALGTKALMSV